MKKTFRAIIVILSLGAASLVAADFWEKKKLSDWTDKEVRKMLTNSPWARVVDVRLGGPVGGPSGGRRGGGSRTPSAGGGGGGDIGGDDTGGGSSRRGGFDAPELPPATPLTIRWHTALPVKQAVAKSRYGDEVMTSPEAAKFLSRQEERYIVGVAGIPAFAFRGADPASLKSNAVLKVKDKPPIRAEEVQASRDQRTVDVFVIFPRGQQGSHVITLEDNEVEFSLDLGRTDIRRKFKLKDMVYEGKLEL